MTSRSLPVKILCLILVVVHTATYSAAAFADELTVLDGSVNNWDTFNVGEGQYTSLSVVDANGAPVIDGRAIVNVLQNYASSINGRLDISGIIAFFNAQGFDIGADADINVVGGLILSTLKISEADFFAGMTALNQASGTPGFISNRGNIDVEPGSFLALIAGAIKNSGTINANGGTAILAAGSEGTLNIGGDGLLSVKITEPVQAEVYDFQGNKVADQIENSGSIFANGGIVKLSARGAEQIFDSIINHSGTISAQSVVEQNGEIFLDGGSEGIVRVSGDLDASGNDAGEKGGRIHVMGNKIGLFDDASIDASGDAGGGEVLVGGDYQGRNEAMENALAVYVGKDASIDVSAKQTGDGGKAIVWSDGSTRVLGTIEAKGGAVSGNGGFIETSGHYLDIDGIHVSTFAEHGDGGKWLLDPYNVTISSGATSNGNFSGDVFTPSGDDSILNIDDLIAALSSADIEVTTGAGGTQDGNIAIADALTSASAFSLTLTAAGAVTINANVDLGGDLSISGVNVNVNNATIVDGAFSVTNTGVLNTGVNGDITAASFTQNGGGSSLLSGDITTADGNIIFNDNVGITNNVSMSTGAGGAGDITFVGTLNGANNLDLAAGTGNIAFNSGIGNVTGLADLSISSAAAVSFNNADSTLDGSVSIAAVNVNLNRGITTTAGGTFTVTNSGTLFVDSSADLSLDGEFIQNGSGPVSLSGDITTTNDSITFSGDVTTGGVVAIDSGSGAGDITFSGSVTATMGQLTLDAGTGDVTATNASNNFGTVILTGHDVNLRDAGSIDIGASTIGGTFDLTGNGSITQSDALSVTGTATIAAGSGNDITLDNTSNDFSTVAITSGRNVSVTDVNGLILGTSTISGTFDVTTGLDLTQSGALTVTGLTTLNVENTHSLTLNSSNDFSSLAIASTQNAEITDINSLIFAASSVSGNLNVSTSGTITDSGNVLVGGAITLAAGSGNDITLNNAGAFNSATVTSGRNVVLNDVDGLELGASTVSGTLDVTAAGTITQSGALTVTGTTTIAAGSGNDITLTDAANNFSTVGITSGNNVSLRDADALNLAASTVSGTLDVTASGAITDSGALAVTGSAAFSAGSANNITLDDSNNFSTVIIGSGNNVVLNDTNALVLAASTVSGTLGVTTSGAITQSGALAVTGTTTIAAGSGNNITLNNASNDFSTVAITTGNDVSLRDAGALILGASTISGTLGVTTAGTITQSAALSVTGTTTLTAGTGNSVTLNNASNDFGAVSIVSANNATLVDTNAITLSSATTAGSLSVTGSTIQLDGNIQTDSDVTLTGNVVLGTGVTIDTDSNNSGAAGGVTITGSVSGNALDRDLAIATNSTGGNGAVSLNTFSNAGGNYLNNVSITTGGGALTLNGNISLDDNGSGGASSLTLSGNGQVIISDNVTIDTEQGNTNGAAGGEVNLGSGTISADASGYTFTINTGNSDAGETGGAVTFGTVSNTAGSYFTGGFVVNSDAATDGVITVGGNVSTDGGAISLTGDVRVSGDRTFDSEIGGGNAGGNITLGGTLSGTAAGAAITFHSLAIGGFAAGNVSLDTFNNAGGSYIRGINADLDGSTDGTLTLNGDIFLDNNGGTAADFFLAGSGNLVISNTLTIDTEIGDSNGVNGGAFNIGSSAISADAAGYTLTINTGNADAGESGGNITIGSVGNTGGGSYLSGLTLNSDSAATDGTITPGSDIYIDSGALSISGILNLSSDRTFDTEQGNNGNGGSVTFGAGSTSGSGSGRTLTINTATTNAGSSGGAVSLGRFNSSTGANVGNLSITTTGGSGGSGGAVTQSDSLNIATATTLSTGSGDITLNNASNDFGTVSVTSGNNVNVRDSGALVLGASTVSGTLSVNTSGAITDSGALAVTGTTTLAAGSGNNITLDNSDNFSTVVISSGNDVTLNDTGAIVLGASTVSGLLTVTAGGNITQSGTVTATGAALDAGSSDIVMNNASNDFNNGTVSLTGDDISIVDTDAAGLVLGDVLASGDFTLTATAGGGVEQALGTHLEITGDTSLNAGTNDILLTRTSNVFSGDVSFTGGNVQLVTSGNLALSGGTASDGFSANADSISQTAALAIDGTATFTASSIIALTDVDNDLETLVIDGGNNVNVVNSGAIVLGTSSIANDFELTAGGNITQAGAVEVGGITTLDAGVNDVDLQDGGNDFATIGVTADEADIVTSGAAALGTVDVTRLNLTAGGSITKANSSVSLDVAGTATFDAGTGDVILNGTNNDLNTIIISDANNVTLTDVSDVLLDNIHADRNVDITVDGNILHGSDLQVEITAGENVSLTAGGYIGTLTDPIDVVITGSLTLSADSQTGGYSAVTRGSAASVRSFGPHPGLMLFNGIDIDFVPSNGVSTETTLELNNAVTNMSLDNSDDRPAVDLGGSEEGESGDSDLIDTSSLDGDDEDEEDQD